MRSFFSTCDLRGTYNIAIFIGRLPSGLSNDSVSWSLFTAMFQLALLVLAASVCCLVTAADNPGPAIKYQAFTDQALSRPISRDSAASSGPRLRRVSPASQPQTTSSNAFWNHRGAVAFSLLEKKNLIEEEPQTTPTTLSPVLNQKNGRRPQWLRQEAGEPYSTTARLPNPVWPSDGQNKPHNTTQRLPNLWPFEGQDDLKSEENGIEVKPDYHHSYYPDRLGAAEGEWPSAGLPEHHNEQRPPAPLPTQDLFNWLRSLMPNVIADELFSAPCRISRSDGDPSPNEPLLLLEEITGTTWRFPRTAQELSVRLMRLAYRAYDDQWDLIKLLARDAVDYKLWEFVTEEEVERGQQLSESEHRGPAEPSGRFSAPLAADGALPERAAADAATARHAPLR